MKSKLVVKPTPEFGKGEKGLFAKMEAYGDSLGMSKAVPSSLNALGGGALQYQ